MITSSILSNFFLLLSTEFVKWHNHKVLSICNFVVAVEHSLHVGENMQNFGCIKTAGIHFFLKHVYTIVCVDFKLFEAS